MPSYFSKLAYNYSQKLIDKSGLSQLTKDNLHLYSWAFFLTPTAFYLRPWIVERNNEKLVLRIKLVSIFKRLSYYPIF